MPRQDPLKPRKKPIQARARRTVEAILEGAAQVFERCGYAATTTDRIAERAGVSIGTLYQYFPGKDAILVSITERHVDEGLALVRRMLDASDELRLEELPLDQVLGSFVGAMIAMHRQRPRLHQMLLIEAPKPADFLDAMSAREDALAVELRALLERHPEVRLTDPDLNVYVLMHVAEGLIHDFVVHPPPGPTDEGRFVTEVVRLLHAYLSPPAMAG